MKAETSRRAKYDAFKLDQLMDFQGRSNVWLGDQLGFDASYISKLRTGAKPITEELAVRISLLLGCPPSLLESSKAEHVATC